MKRFSLLLLALVAIVPAEAKRVPVMKNAADSLSYAIGMLMQEELKRFSRQADIEPNVDIFTAALRSAANGSAAFDNDEASAYLNYFFSEEMPRKNKAESAAYLASVKKENRKVQETPSGLLYEIITPGGEERIDDNRMTARVNYTMWTPDGTEIDSSDGEPVEFVLDRVIPGFSEGVKLVGKGGKVKFWIPSDLGYGEHTTNGIGPNQALLTEAELIEFFLPDPEAYSSDEDDDGYGDDSEYDESYEGEGEEYGDCTCGCDDCGCGCGHGDGEED
ncbi:MAG: FKBP-type peptidyl-prolyl cis-trans isomerase [Rikenellaceae bacterium]|jgi:FKBP-type peptidyl-prolyl cis-trans isomerase|nr:FKBP-type peptidyl-prolyl cis-trans isomerase [Rikenellaceae bacterium]